MQQEQGLAIARLLVKSGMPVFVAHPDPSSPQGFRLPMGWQQTECDPSVVDSWRPGMALCAVTGRAFDLVDIDPRSGGTEDAIPMPHSYLAAETPSGGRHHFVSALGVASRDGVAPGVDIKSGTLEGTGRGFAFIAPTVRRSKTDGLEREYRWYTGPDGPGLPSADQRAADGSGAKLRGLVMELRRTQPLQQEPRRVPLSVAVREFERAMHGLADDVRRWKVMGWGGEAHSGLLAATTHLARLNHERAEAAFVWAFRSAGAEPNGDDLAKLHSAIERAVPDIVIPDEQLTAQERFFLGGDSPLGVMPSLGVAAGGVGFTGSASGLLTGSPGGEVTGRRRFQPMSRAEAANIVPPDSLVAGLLLSNTKARLSAPSGSGKTWVVLDIAAHVAMGMPWQGREVAHRKVLYVAGEGAPSFDQRITAWEQKHGITADIDIVPDAPQIASGDWELFCAEVSEGGYGFIIFDTQSSITVGLEENSNKDANVALARLDIVRRITGACVLLVHHTGHEENGRARGASAWLGGLDTELMLSGPLGDLQLKSVKQKYIESGKPVRLRLERCGGGLVLAVLQAPQNSADGFFGDVGNVEHAARIDALHDRIKAYYAAGGTAKASVRSLTNVLRVELGVTGRTEDLREAIRRYTAGLGMPVEQAVDLRAHSA
jgi:hypothetical protein